MVLRALTYVASLWLLSLYAVTAWELFGREGSKHAIKTIKTKYGVYDCIDFYKQPAFDHPLLQNHRFYPEMRPIVKPKWASNSNSLKAMNATEAKIIFLKDGGCPRGTVPIRRMNEKFDTKVHPQLSAGANNSMNQDISGIIYAVAHTTTKSPMIYNGVEAKISVYNPRALRNQYSSGEIILRSGTEALITGWTVNPHKYGDNRTRFFVYAVAEHMRCFNLQCGFVHVRSDLPIDFPLQPISQRGGEYYVQKFRIHQDPVSRNWWVEVGSDPPVSVGFWPENIFAGLKRSATYAACGGEVYTPPTLPPPEMGAGAVLSPSVSPDDAYCTDYRVLNENFDIVDPKTKLSEPPLPYDVFDGHSYDNYHLITFGGP